MDQRFASKVALITGAGSGIGQAVVRRLVAEGASVLGVDVMKERLADTARLITEGGAARFHPYHADLSDPDACEAAVAACVDRFGGLDVLGNVAGIYLIQHTSHLTREQYRRVMAVNADAPFFLAQAALPHLLRRDGNIVNIASNAGLQGVPYSAAYCMSKGAVVQLTRSLAVEFIKTPIRVNAIAPAGTRTNIATGVTFPPDMDPDLAGRMAGLRGVSEPDHIAALFAFLASDEAAPMTGAVVTADNGMTVS